MLKPRRLSLTFLACLALISCIEVRDFGVYWDKGTVDPLLAGGWLPDNGDDSSCLLFEKNTSQYRLLVGEGEELYTRSLTLGKHTFLMMRKPSETEGQIIKYAVTADVFQLYQLNANKKDEFTKNFPDSGVDVSNNGKAIVQKLDDKTAANIEKASDQPDYWTLLSTYKHSSCTPSFSKD